jgi:hypothetical protein
MRAITHDTLVPIGFIVVLAACIYWLSGLAQQIRTQEETMERFRDKFQRTDRLIYEQNEKISSKLEDILLKVSRIEGKLEHK